MAPAENRDPWFTAKRLRAHGLILALCLWSIYAWNMTGPGLRDRAGNLKGTDFLHFYTLGSLALTHRGPDLYDMNAQAQLAAQRVPAAAGIRYLPLYPPQVSLLFSPLARLSYGWALVLWLSCSAMIYGLCCYTMWQACPRLAGEGWTAAFLAAGFPGFFHLIAWGQSSAIALACFTAMYFLLRDERGFLAGLVLGCLIFKPQLGLAAAVVFVCIGAWKVAGGAILSATAQLAAGYLYYGAEPLRAWVRALWNVPGAMSSLEPKAYHTHSLRTFWTMLLPWPRLSLALYLLSACAVLALTVAFWRKAPAVPLALKYSCLLFATVLVSPHLTVYDLVILAPAFFLLSDWLISPPGNLISRRMELLLYLAGVLPLLGPLDVWTHVRFSVLAMAGLVYLIWLSAGRVSGRKEAIVSA